MKKPTRILCYCGGSYVAGVEIVTLDLMAELRRRGHEVMFVVNGWNDGDFINRLKASKFPYQVAKLGFFYLSNLRWSLDTLRHFPTAFWTCWRTQKSYQPDVIWHVNERSVFMLGAIAEPEKTVFSVHNYYARTRLNRFLFSFVDRKVRVIQSCAEYTKQAVQELGVKTDICVVNNGTSRVASKSLPTQHGVATQALRIGLIGQIISTKKHHVVLEALQQLHLAGADWHLFIFGTGNEDYILRLKSQIRKSGLEEVVTWAGYVQDCNQIYSRLDCVIGAGREAYPLVAIEAANYCLPVVAARLGGLQEIVRDGVTGLLFAPDDAASLAEKLQMLINDRKLAQRLGAQARKVALTEYTIEKMGDRIEEMFARTICRQAS